MNGVTDLTRLVMPAKQTLPILFSKAGYQTAMIGKWHLKVEPNFGYYKVLPGQGKYFDTEFRVQGDKPWPKNVVTHKGGLFLDAITDSALHWFGQYDKDKPFFICHQFKAPHDYFENAPRYQKYLADVKIPEPPTLYDMPDTFGSIATRGYNDELLPHIGTSIGKRNPRRSYAVDLKERFPEELPADYDVARHPSPACRLAYPGYLRKYLRCVKGVDVSSASSTTSRPRASTTTPSSSTPATRVSGSAKTTTRTSAGPMTPRCACPSSCATPMP